MIYKMKYVFLLASLLLSAELFGQSGICVPDSTTGGKLIGILIKEGESGVSVTRKKNNLKLNATRLCEHHATVLESLDKVLTDSQVDELILCDNGTLTAAGFIIFANRAKSKTQLVNKLSLITKSNYRIITNGCSDAIQTIPLSQFVLNLLKDKNSFINVNYAFNKKEVKQLEEEIRKQSEQFWRK